MPRININWKNFIAGESANDWTPNGGFSPKSFGLNLTKERGQLYFAENPTDISGNLGDDIVATCIDPELSGNDLYLVGDDAHFYRLNGTTLTDVITGGNTYQVGTSDMTPFEGSFYATSQTAVAQFNNNVGTLVENWWSGLTTGVRHPLEVVESELFIGNNNEIFFYDGSSSGTAFTLPTTQNVTTLRRHPDGKTLLAFTGDAKDFSHGRNGGGKVYYCDPVLRDWTREVVIESQVEGSRTVGGTIYVTWGDNVGYFDGNGLKFLKKLGNATTYSQSMNKFEDFFIIRDTTKVKAFGNLGSGRVWWNMYKDQVNGFSLSAIAYLGGNQLLTSSSGGTLLDITDYDNTGSAGQFFSNRTYFEDEAEIGEIELVHDSANGSGNTDFDIASVTVSGASQTIESIAYVNQTTTKTKFSSDVKSDIYQMVLEPKNDDIGYKLIRTHYDGV